MPDEFDAPRKVYKLKPREDFVRANAPGPSAADTNQPVDVFQMRAEQRAIEQQAGVDEVDLTPPPNRRRREFITLLVLNNAFFGGATYFGLGNPLIMACGVAGMTIGSFGAYWLIYHIMGRY